MKKKSKSVFNVGTFNVRGLSDQTKKEQLVRDCEKYEVDVCCIQETKIKEGWNSNVNGSRIITLPTDMKDYGNGFVIGRKWVDKIYRFWKVSDRICVLQVNTGTEIKKEYEVKETSSDGMRVIVQKTAGTRYHVKETSKDKMKTKVIGEKKRKIITIICVYAPTTDRVKKNPHELTKLYKQLEKLCKEMKKSTSTTIIAGDFNAKVGKRSSASEQSIGNWSRGIRNESGSKLVDFCEKEKRTIANTCFQHPARHITTWSQKRKNSEGTGYNVIYNQIDYIIIDSLHTHTLQDARTYSGTETFSDHRLVVTRIHVHWATFYKHTPKPKNTKQLNVKELAVKPECRAEYQEMINQQLQTDPQMNNENRWDRLKNIMKSATERTAGRKPCVERNQIADSQLIMWSVEQKEMRLKIERCRATVEVDRMKRQRQEILKKMTRRKKMLREEEVDRILADVEQTKDDNRMFKAVKSLHTRRKQIMFVQDDEGKNVSSPQEIYKVINKYFKEQLHKPDQTEVEKFKEPGKRLNNPISGAEVYGASKQMSNDKAAGKDDTYIEMIKYGPESLFDEIAVILNNIFEHNDDHPRLGVGILQPIPKPNKPQGPAKNLRPVTLLEIIRKILSKIVMNRVNNKINSHLDQSQSAYRKGRATTDIVWAYRWIAAKTQKEELTVYSTGIDMSSAFDTIERSKIVELAEKFLDKDEVRMLRTLLSDTTIEVRVRDADTQAFKSNIGSPQGDSISGPLFTIYLNNALHEVEERLEKQPIDARDLNQMYKEMMESELPPHMEYADDVDFLTEIPRKQKDHHQIAKEVLQEHNLLVNASKTEEITIRRGTVDEERWREAVKLGSKLGDREDMKRRRNLATVAMKDNDNVWKKQWAISLKKRLRLYGTLVESILMYNCGTWGMSRKDEESMNSFHRKQLRRVLGVRWPHTISSRKLYNITNTQPISLKITERRWKLLGHILRLKPHTPARKAMRYYFESRTAKKFRGRPRTTIVTTINNDIKRAREKFRDFKGVELVSHVSLQNMCHKARNRKLWSTIVRQVVNSAYSY